MAQQQQNDLIASIARRVLRIDTLEERKSDALDFHEVAVWTIKRALEETYESGRRDAFLESSAWSLERSLATNCDANQPNAS